MILTLFNACTHKGEIIKRNVEDEKSYFLDMIYELPNGFHVDFYNQVVESTIADAYEFFVELDCENNFFYENLKIMNLDRGHRFYKLMAMYHTIRILRKRRQDIDSEEMKEALFVAYSFDIKEQKLFNLLYSCACNFEKQFPALFSKAFAKYLFGKDNCSIFTLAFIDNFCYNSHVKFLSSFTRYISVGRRLKRAESL